MEQFRTIFYSVPIWDAADRLGRLGVAVVEWLPRGRSVNFEKMRKKIAEMRARTEDSWTFASEKLFSESMDAYFVFEEKLEQVDHVLVQIERELEDAGQDEIQLRQLSGRLAYLEDHFEDIDSGARNRPRRRSRFFNLSDFFRQGDGDGTEPQNEFKNEAQAYDQLGLSVGTTMREVTTVFRRLVKELHPDARGGDRTTEPRLRKVVAAYEFLKRNRKLAT